MKKIEKKSDIPEILDFDELCEFLNIEKFPYKNFYFEKIQKKTDLINISANPFRHHFYAISLILDGKGSFNTGFWKSNTKKNILYFKTPYQVVSWDFDPDVIKKYAVVFTEEFIEQHFELGNIIFEFPFFHLDRTIPLQINESDVIKLSAIYENIDQLYKTKSSDQFNIMASYIKILLLNIRQIYENSLNNDQELISLTNKVQKKNIQKFISKLKEEINIINTENRDISVAYFAKELGVHPSHLSATLKKNTGKTAQEHIHNALLSAAKTLLLQTDLSIKEIAYRLAFNEPAHFTNFFKKQQKVTPIKYRNSKKL